MSAGERNLAEAIVSIGFSKDTTSLRINLPVFNALVRRVLKMRMMGSAALALAYVAGGRFDAYVESGIRIWDIAAGGFILERAGGDFWRKAIAGEHKYAHAGQQRPAAPKSGARRPRGETPGRHQADIFQGRRCQKIVVVSALCADSSRRLDATPRFEPQARRYTD